MTNPHQQQIDELYRDLHEERKHCEHCPTQDIAEACHECSVFGNINDFEQQIAALQEDT